MHAECEEFIRRVAPLAKWRNVVEVGALNVNGRVRDLVLTDGETAMLDRRWWGIDLIPGDGVDQVGDAVDILASRRVTKTVGFDTAVATEVLEHARYWADIVRQMCRVLRDRGVLVITCAGPDRPPHAADGSGPPRAGEFYQNVSLDALTAVLPADMVVVHAEYAPDPGDTRLVARRSWKATR